ncbi:hypothetical protein HBA92_18115 [Ochrobactrum sp. MR28]|nr:hypothetical protein [Ochrobactrum sp. MR28]MBX8818222.1 hypothetical protein [Ochrobactrum sp. MR31]
MFAWLCKNPALIAMIGAVLFAGGVFSDVYYGRNAYAAFLLIMGVTLFSKGVSQIWNAAKLFDKKQRFQYIIIFFCGAVIFLLALLIGRSLVTAWLTGELRVAVRGGAGGFFVNYYENAKKFGFYFTFYTIIAPICFVAGLLMMLKPRLFRKPLDKQ